MRPFHTLPSRRLALAISAAAVAASSLLAGCAPLVLGGAAVGSAFVVSDRRTSGAQLEDQTNELKAPSRIKDAIGERGHVNVTSYNRVALITGEVDTDADKSAVEAAISKIEGVRSVVNELAVMQASSLSARSSDVLLATKVKATLIDAKDVHANAFKVVVERGIVYLMGRVTEAEATRAVDLARSVAGVQKVVRVVEVISEEELQTLNQR